MKNIIHQYKYYNTLIFILRKEGRKVLKMPVE